MVKMDKHNLIDIYKIAVEEETHFLDMHQSRVKFFLGIVSALLAGTVAGLFKSTLWYEFALMSLGPILIAFTCFVSMKGVFRLYQRFLEAVTVRAKIEQQLGMTLPLPNTTKNDYWSNEPVIAPRHLKSRREHPTSEKWLEQITKQGYNSWTDKFFLGGYLLAAVLLIIIVLLSFNADQLNVKKNAQEKLSVSLSSPIDVNITIREVN